VLGDDVQQPRPLRNLPLPDRRRYGSGLLDAADDDRLFGFDLWPRQRDLVAAVERGPRLHVWALGRRSGKTTIAALVMLWDALLRQELNDRVRPGERRYSVGVATNLRQARLLVRAAASRDRWNCRRAGNGVASARPLRPRRRR
jgi:hypothetical protein